MRPRLLRLAVAPLFAMFFPSASGAQEAYRGQGVLLFLEGGVRRPGFGEVGTHLASQGFEEAGAFPTFGAALGFCVGRIHSELGFDLGAQTLRSRLTSAETSLEENGLRFDIGYAVLKARRHALLLQPLLAMSRPPHPRASKAARSCYERSQTDCKIVSMLTISSLPNTPFRSRHT